jgi:putative acetyltransferase
MTSSADSTSYDIESYSDIPEARAAFRSISEEWLLKYFNGSDPADEVQLNNPQKIVDEGGYICMVRVNGAIVAAGGLCNRGDGDYEIIKMGVRDAFQGRGIGRAVLAHLIARARSIPGIKALKIETSSKLSAALKLYRAHGFVEDPETQKSFHEYKDADIFLHLPL